jgi:hypothetical protein
MFEKSLFYTGDWELTRNYRRAFTVLCIFIFILALVVLGVIIVMLVRASECNLGGFAESKEIGNHNMVQFFLMIALGVCIIVVLMCFIVSLGMICFFSCLFVLFCTTHPPTIEGKSHTTSIYSPSVLYRVCVFGSRNASVGHNRFTHK